MTIAFNTNVNEYDLEITHTFFICLFKLNFESFSWEVHVLHYPTLSFSPNLCRFVIHEDFLERILNVDRRTTVTHCRKISFSICNSWCVPSHFRISFAWKVPRFSLGSSLEFSTTPPVFLTTVLAALPFVFEVPNDDFMTKTRHTLGSTVLDTYEALPILITTSSILAVHCCNLVICRSKSDF